MQILKAQGQFQFDEEEAKEIIDELTEKYNPKDSGKLQYPGKPNVEVTISNGTTFVPIYLFLGGFMAVSTLLLVISR